MKRTFPIVVCSLIILLSSLAFVYVSRGPVSSQPSSWPAMTMIYRVEGSFNGLDQPSQTMTWKLDYTDAHHWQRTLIDSTVDPRAIGDSYTFDGSVYSMTSVVTGETTTEKQDGVWVDWWLIPWRDITLEDKGYSKDASDSEDVTVYAKSEQIKCQPDPDNVLTGVVQPATCGTVDSYEAREVVTYRSDFIPAIPIDVVTQIGDSVTSRIIVTDLTIHSPTGDVTVIG